MKPALIPLALTILALAGPVAAAKENYPKLDAKGIGKDAQALIVQVLDREDGSRAKLEELARSGRTDAAEVLGEMLSNGPADLDDDAKGTCDWFEIAARDRADGRHNLAVCYEHGQGGKVDLPRAARLYGEASDMGFAKAKCALGTMLVAGKGVPIDAKRGVALCTEAAEAGGPDAQADVGDFYLMGQGVPQDYAKAAFWYEKAAAQKQANAAFLLGQMYWNGDGVTKDHARSAELWRIAYDGGRPDAPFLLGREAVNRALADKSGVMDAKALEEAIGWMELAAESDPNPEHRKMMADGLPIMRASLELARKMKPLKP
jgi:TPR repeat protein